MRIINIFALFENPTGDPGWQLWDGDVLVGVYRTRDQARTEARLVSAADYYRRFTQAREM